MRATLFIIWMFFTVVLALSVVGLIVFAPVNTGQYIRPQEKTRSTWMRIGYKLLNDTNT